MTFDRYNNYSFKVKSDDYILTTYNYIVDGYQVTISKWDDDARDYFDVYNKRVIDDTYFMTLFSALEEVLDLEGEHIEHLIAEQLDVEVNWAEEEEEVNA